MRWSIPLLILISASCKVRTPDPSTLKDSTQRPVTFNELTEGDLFRISPTNEPSQCYLPDPSLQHHQPCGDVAYYRVYKTINKDAGFHMIESLLTGECLELSGHQSPRTVTCGKEGSPQHLQARNFKDYMGFYTTNGLPADRQMQLTPIVQSRTPGQKFITTQVAWGNIPRLEKIRVALRNSVFTSGGADQIPDCQDKGYAVEAKFIFDTQEVTIGKPQTLEQVRYETLNLDPDEYLTKVEFKEAETSCNATQIQNRFWRLAQLRFHSNKSDAGKKNPWLVGELPSGDASNSAEWMVAKAPTDAAIVGVWGRAIWDGTSIQGMGFITMPLISYKAHFPAIFASSESSRKVYIEKSKNFIGKDFTFEPFDTSLYANQLESSRNLSILRIYDRFDNERGRTIIAGLAIRPSDVGGDVDFESYGDIQGRDPALFFELSEGEYIGRIYTKLEGDRIGALRFVVYKGTKIQHVYNWDPGQMAEPWELAFYKEGSAIVGFYGDRIGAHIHQLGVWYADFAITLGLEGTESAPLPEP